MNILRRGKNSAEPHNRIDTELEGHIVIDRFFGGETLEDQVGADGVITFTFTSDVDWIVVLSSGGISRADCFGGDPTSSRGIKCPNNSPTPIPVTASVVKVYAPSGTTVSVWGYRYSPDE